jgi:alanyl-tRNA synthetase
MGEAFPELIAKEALIIETLKREEEAFHKTLEKGLILFETESAKGVGISAEVAFKLYDEQGFPLDLTELLARERGLTVDTAGFEVLMEQQRARARAAQKKEIISLSELTTTAPTAFSGFDDRETEASVLEVVQIKNRTAIILDRSVCYAEMGGQVGDTATLNGGGSLWQITDTQKSGPTWLHFIGEENDDPPLPGQSVTLNLHTARRAAIQRHHSVTHLLHWALREVLGETVSQKGSFVGPDKLTFDFASGAMTPEQITEVDRLVNERILENTSVSWQELPFTEVKGRPGILQFFGDKYGDLVRVVQIGGTPGALDGYSMELCGGTHVRATGEIGSFRIVSESAVAAGVRRIEAIAGLEAYYNVRGIIKSYKRLADLLKAQTNDLENRVSSLLEEKKELDESVKYWRQREGSDYVEKFCKPELIGSVPAWIHILDLKKSGIVLVQNVLDGLKIQDFQGVAVLAGTDSINSVQLASYVSPEFRATLPAGKIISAVAPLVGGKGGGKPDSARGGGRDATGLSAALEKARELIAVGKI